MRDQKTYAFYGRFLNDSHDYGNHDPATFGKGEHALRAKDYKPGDYEIGVVKALDGNGFELLVDTWGPGRKLIAKAGQNLDGLRREYAASVATRKAQATLGRKGFTLSREDLPGNRIRLRLRRR